MIKFYADVVHYQIPRKGTETQCTLQHKDEPVKLHYQIPRKGTETLRTNGRSVLHCGRVHYLNPRKGTETSELNMDTEVL